MDPVDSVQVELHHLEVLVLVFYFHDSVDSVELHHLKN